MFFSQGRDRLLVGRLGGDVEGGLAKQQAWNGVKGIDASELPGDEQAEQGGFGVRAFRRAGAPADFARNASPRRLSPWQNTTVSQIVRPQQSSV
jgi:hypothetical protein